MATGVGQATHLQRGDITFPDCHANYCGQGYWSSVAMMMLQSSLYCQYSYYYYLFVLGPKQKKKQSVFDEELTNTSRKALKQYRAG